MRLDRLVEAALAVVEAGELHVDVGVVRLGGLGGDEHLLGLFVRPGVLVDLREREVVGRFAWIQLNHLLDDRFGLGRVVQLVGAVGRHEVVQGQLTQFLVFRLGRRREPLGGPRVVLDRLLHQGVVVRFALLARLVLLVVAVAEEEVGRLDVLVLGVGGDGLFVRLSSLLVVLSLIALVGRLERFSGLDHVHLAARGRERTQRQHRDRRQRCPRQRSH